MRYMMLHVSESPVQFLPYQKGLPRQEQKELLDAYRAGDTEARDKLFASVQGMAVRAARSFPSRTFTNEELLQVAFVGIMDAMHETDFSRGGSFSAMAWKRAHWAIANALKTYNPVRNRSHSFRDIASNYYEAYHDIMKRGVEPTAATIAQELQVDVEEVVLYESHMPSFDNPDFREGPYRFYHFPDQDKDLELHPLRDAIARLRPYLNEKEVIILDCHILSEDPCTYEEIGEVWGVSKQRVHQIAKKLIAKIKAEMEAR